MDQNDTLLIGPYKYIILKRKENRVLVSWIESDGKEREMWMILRRSNNIQTKKAA